VAELEGRDRRRLAEMEAGVATAQVKKSILLDEDLDVELKASAKRHGRSASKELNYLLRAALAENVVVIDSVQDARSWASGFDKEQYTITATKPDPKVKPTRSSKKLK
jgi:plasmid stability protein